MKMSLTFNIFGLHRFFSSFGAIVSAVVSSLSEVKIVSKNRRIRDNTDSNFILILFVTVNHLKFTSCHSRVRV